MERSHPQTCIVVDASNNSQKYFAELVRYRELLYFLAWRDIVVRYKQAFFGTAWALFRPLLNMVVFTFIFGRIANLPSDNVNYGLFVLAGMLPWLLFSGTALDNCNSLINNAHLITKVYFPRILIPISQTIVHLLDFAIAGLLLLVAVIIMHGISLSLLALPIFIALTCMLCVGIGLWLSALTVKYRDFRILVPVFIQLGMFISPVGYGTFLIPEKWRLLYFLNPLVGIIDGTRWSLFGIMHADFLLSIAFSIFITLSILLSGLIFFKKMERTFADQI